MAMVTDPSFMSKLKSAAPGMVNALGQKYGGSMSGASKAAAPALGISKKKKQFPIQSPSTKTKPIQGGGIQGGGIIQPPSGPSVPSFQTPNVNFGSPGISGGMSGGMSGGIGAIDPMYNPFEGLGGGGIVGPPNIGAMNPGFNMNGMIPPSPYGSPSPYGGMEGLWPTYEKLSGLGNRGDTYNPENRIPGGYRPSRGVIY